MALLIPMLLCWCLGRLQELLETDQLRGEMSAQRAFLGFTEGQLSFEPTFKVREHGKSGLLCCS
jgi:hypothetical protein